MFTAREIAQLRNLTEAAMVDACEIRRQGTTTLNTTTGTATQAAGTLVYSGKCRVAPSGPSASVQTVGNRDIPYQYVIVYIPIDSDFVKKDDLVTITAATYDTTMVGEVFRVTGVNFGTYAASRSMSCQSAAASAQTAH